MKTIQALSINRKFRQALIHFEVKIGLFYVVPEIKNLFIFSKILPEIIIATTIHPAWKNVYRDVFLSTILGLYGKDIYLFDLVVGHGDAANGYA